MHLSKHRARRALALIAAASGLLCAGVGVAPPASAVTTVASAETVWDGGATITYRNATAFDLAADTTPGTCEDVVTAYPAYAGLKGCSATLSASLFGAAAACTGVAFGTLTISHVGLPSVSELAVVKIVGGVGTFEAVGAQVGSPPIATAGEGTIAIPCLYSGGEGTVATGLWAGHSGAVAAF